MIRRAGIALLLAVGVTLFAGSAAAANSGITPCPTSDWEHHPACARIDSPVGTSGATAYLRLYGSDPDTTFDLDFDGDGDYDRTTQDSLISHVFTLTGTHKVTLRATDSLGRVAYSSTSITIDKGSSERKSDESTPRVLDQIMALVVVTSAIALPLAIRYYRQVGLKLTADGPGVDRRSISNRRRQAYWVATVSGFIIGVTAYITAVLLVASFLFTEFPEIANSPGSTIGVWFYSTLGGVIGAAIYIARAVRYARSHGQSATPPTEDI